MQLQILLALIIFILQPVFWVGLIRTYLSSRKRMRNTRELFRTAIYSRHFELWQFVINGVLLGVVGSIVTLLMGPVVALLWVGIYQCLLLINLLLIPGIVFSFELLIFSAVATLGLGSNGDVERLIHNISLQQVGMRTSLPAAFNYVLLASFFLLGLALIIVKDGGKFNVPIIERNERQFRIAGYPFKSLSVVPLLLFIPGDLIHSWFQYWPVLMLNGHSVAFMFVPVLFGFRMTIFKQQPRTAFKKLGGRLAQLGLVGLGLTVINYFYSLVAIPSLAILLIAFWILVIRAKRVDKNSGDWYSEVINGVRVIGIEPKTPAAKMGLSIGDVILEVNNVAVTNEDEFYQALLKHSTYCRLKIKNRNGDLAITETAIFSNSPHEIGIVLFKQES